MNFVDTHTHLYSEEFDPDRDAVVRNAVEKGVTRLILPAIDLTYHERMMDLANRYPGHCFPMIGLHPTSVKSNYREDLDFIGNRLAEERERFYGIGEIGIDLYWDKTHAKEQEDTFEIQLDWAVQYGLPVAIHTRNSFDIATGIIRKKNDPRLKGIFHCFGGSVEQAKQAIELGFLLGIGGIITYKNSGLQRVVAETSLEYLVLETDAPWLPPVPHRGQRNESAYLPVIAQKIAEIKQLSIEEVAEKTTQNAISLFNLNNMKI
jgi:TatD DNase family protein